MHCRRSSSHPAVERRSPIRRGGAGFGPHAVLSLEYNPVPSQSDKLRDLGEGLGRNVQMLSGPFLTPPAPVRPLAVSPSTVVRSKTSLLLNFNNHVFGPYLRPPEKQLGNK